MIGKQENSAPKKICPLCGGELYEGIATLPFVFGQNVLIIKDVPAEICAECEEPYLSGQAVDRVQELFQRSEQLSAEVSVVSYHAA